MRLDAIKHYSERFLRAWIQHLDASVARNWFFVGEYWTSNLKDLSAHLKRFNSRMSLFDVQLVYNLSNLSQSRHGDLRTVFEGTLSKHYPANAVTFVQNHDTQETQALAAPVEPWFTAHAYALILLRANGGYPCVFYGDLYGIHGPCPRPPACGGKLPKLILARKLFAYGRQFEYFDQPDCIGWTRLGHATHSAGAGLAVVLNTSWSFAQKPMYIGRHCAGQKWTDIMDWAWGEVVIDENGIGVFPVGHRSMGVWVNAVAEGRTRLDRLIL